MDSNICECDPKSVNPSRDFHAKGKMHVFIVLNMKNFIEESSQENFERLRGGQAFSKATKLVAPEKYFIEDEYEAETLERGHEFQVFRGHLKDDWLYKTYLLKNDQAPPPPDINLIKDWKRFEFRIRVSRTGFLEIRLTKYTHEIGENIITILREQMEMGSKRHPDSDPHSAQLRLALYCANLFVDSIQNTIQVQETEGSAITQLPLIPIKTDPESLPYRQRHTVLFFNEIICQHCGNRINADKLWQDYGTTLAAILEGALIRNQDDQLEFPEMDDESTGKFDDLATWKDELCVFAPERSLIYIPKKKIFLSGQIGRDPVKYEHYWECINRGIEHTIVVRAALQIIEYNTTRDLDEVPRLTQRVVDGDVTTKDKKEISRMAQAISNTFNVLPLLRDVLVPSSSFRASYAVNKFEILNSVLHLKDIKEHVERNVDELVSFIQFFSSMEVQDELNKSETSINRIGIVVAVVAMLVAGPSFLADYNQLFVRRYGWPEWSEWVIFALIGILATRLILPLFKQTKKKRSTFS